MKKFIAVLTICALCIPAFGMTAFAQEESIDDWEIIECTDDPTELENLPELPHAEPLRDDRTVRSKAASISVNVQSPLENSWRKKYDDPKAEAKKIIDRSDDFLSSKFGIQFNVIAQPNWTMSSTSGAGNMLKDAVIKTGKGKADLVIGFAGPLADNGDKAVFGVAFNGRPFALIFDHDHKQNCKSTQHEVGHTYGLQHCNNTCVMRPGWDENWQLFDHLCSSHERQWDKAKNKYHH